MPLFKRSAAQVPPIRTVNGRPQPTPEGPGTIPRRHRLFIECARRLAAHQLTQPSACGRPLADGMGMESLVAEIRPLFLSEKSMMRWVALRGALAEISIRVLEQGMIDDLEAAMGLTWVERDGREVIDIAEPWRSQIDGDAHEMAIGVAGATLIRAEEYGRIEDMSVADVNQDPTLQISPAVALDIIAWSAAAMLRMGVTQQLFDVVPEPDALTNPGWYAEPLFSKAERYWDGEDWTGRCRVPDGRGYRESSMPLS
jgi:hypothetical protein